MRWSAAEIQRRISSMDASAGRAEAQAEHHSRTSPRTRGGSPSRSTHSATGTSRSSSPWASGGSDASWRRAAASSAATARSNAPEVLHAEREEPRAPLPAEHPLHVGGQRVVLARDAVAVALRPHVRLAVRHPGAAHVEVEAAQGVALQPHAPADPLARLQHGHAPPAGLEVARRDEAGEPGADDEDVEHAASRRARRIRRR